MLVEVNIIIAKQFVLDFNKNTAFIGSYSWLFDLDIETLEHIIQQLVYAKIKATILHQTKAMVPIYHLDIPNSQDFFFLAAWW